MLTCDHYEMAMTLSGALHRLATEGERARVVAGATDMLPWAREGRAGDVHVPVLIDVSQLPELRERKVAGGRVRLGAATPFQRFLDDPALQAAMPGMDRCALWFADDQIRECATLGGNIVNASPAADGLPPLLAMNASIEVAGLEDGALVVRTIPLDVFLQGPGRTALGRDEILVAVEADALFGYGGAFEKVGHRRSLVISVACISALVRLDDDGRRFGDVRLAIGGVGPVPRRMGDIEAALNGAPITGAAIVAAARNGVDYVRSRSRVEYRRAVIPGFVFRAISAAVEAAGAHPDALLELREPLHA